mgnify:CR=1 FL=1
MKKLTLYTNPHSRGTNVRWMLEECGAHYETVGLAYGTTMKQADYLAINPMGKVPALKVDDAVITETAAILTWLAERYPEKALIPEAGSDARGEYYRWLCFALHLEYAAVDRMRTIENSTELRTAIGYGDFDTAFAVLKARLQDRAHIIGEQFTALDLYYSGLLQWLIQRAQVLPADSVYLDYMNRHLARPAHQRAIALDEALLAEMG